MKVFEKVTTRLHAKSNTYREYDSPRWYPGNKYIRGELPPNYPVPALPLRDLEYIYLENERNRLTLELARLQNEPFN